MLANRGATDAVSLEDVLAGLRQLKEMIYLPASEPHAVAGIGHNNPPEAVVVGAEELSGSHRRDRTY